MSKRASCLWLATFAVIALVGGYQVVAAIVAKEIILACTGVFALGVGTWGIAQCIEDLRSVEECPRHVGARHIAGVSGGCAVLRACSNRRNRNARRTRR